MMKRLKEHPSFICLFLGIILLLLLSIKSYEVIPFGDPDGLDFHNLYSYSTCDEALEKYYDNNIYLAGGRDCRDAMGREFVYPPLLFYTTNWVGHFTTFAAARFAWRSFIILSLLFCLYIWIGSLKHFLLTLPFTGLLFVQFPMLFALERGNNDIMVIITWTASFYFYKDKKDFLAGLLAISSVFMKIYPLFAFSIILGGAILKALLKGSHRERKRLTNFVLGTGSISIFYLLIFRELWFSWFLRLSHFTDFKMVISYLNHSIQYIFDSPSIVKLIYVGGLFLWLIAFALSKEEEQKFAFAGALAITTFYSGVSYDYNLITVYPLILVVLIKCFKEHDSKMLFVLFILLFGVIGNKSIFDFGENLGFKLRIIIQFFSISGLAIFFVPFWRVKQLINFLKIKNEVSRGHI